MTDLQYPEWQKAWHEAQVETDESKLRVKAHKAETAIFMRLQGISGSLDHHEERLAIKDAISNLRKLQTQKLKFPENIRQTARSRRP